MFVFAVFDKQIPVDDEHKKIHATYRKLVHIRLITKERIVAGSQVCQIFSPGNFPCYFQVDTLLETFCKDAGITFEEVMHAIDNMKTIDAIKEVFQVQQLAYINLLPFLQCADT